MSSIRLNDVAWEQLFNKYDILRCIEKDGVFNISAQQIREYREPRLMAKFDHTINLPQLFYDNKLAILPITRGDYVISHFDAYHRFETDNAPVIKVSFPDYIQSLDFNNILSESMALNCAVASGIVAEFMEDNDIIATVSGRMGSGLFSFNIDDICTGSSHHINVNNSQIEIDAAFEGVSCLALFEAKIDLSEDFLIRQLYYPFRVWHRQITKPVKPIFLVYSNGIYRLFEYEFEDPNSYSSLRLVKQRNYSVEDTAISVSDIYSVLDNTNIVYEPKIPFPQADKFERVINICELVSVQELNRTDVTERYDFDARQTNYYTDAARYLGLLEKKLESGVPIYSISNIGRCILNLSYKQRQLAYCNCILSHSVFNTTLRLYLKRGVMPDTNEIVCIMKQSGLYHVESDSTYIRRSSSVKGWVNWIVSLINA